MLSFFAQWIFDSLAEEAEERAKAGSYRTLYHITKKIAGNKKPTGQRVKNKNINVLTNIKQKIKRAEKFKEVQNRPSPSMRFDFRKEESSEILDVSCGPIKIQKVIV